MFETDFALNFKLDFSISIHSMNFVRTVDFDFNFNGNFNILGREFRAYSEFLEFLKFRGFRYFSVTDLHSKTV